MTATPLTTDRPPVPYRISLGVGTGSLLQPLNSSMIAVALVTIAAELRVDNGISWLISALYLATAVAAPTAGRLADLYGARRVFFGGLVLVALGGALGPLLPSLSGLILARVVLGLGTAAQYPAAMAIIRARAERRSEDASKALAVLGVCAQVSVAFGPTLGGLLVSGLGWRSIFWINLVLAAVAGLWVWRATDPADQRLDRSSSGSLWTRLDLAGLLLFAAFLTVVMLFLMSLVGSPSWWWLALAVPTGAGLLWRELGAAQPFLDVRMLSHRPRLLIIFARQLLVSTAFYSVFYVLPQWLEGVRRYSPEQSGLLVIPVAAVGVVSTLVASAWIRRRGVAPTLLVGNLGLIGAGVLIALTLTAGTSWWTILAIAALLGIPNGFNNMANQNELYAVAQGDIGAASGLLRTTQYVGANLSAAMIEVLVGGAISDAGLHRVGWGIAAVSVVLLLVTSGGWLALSRRAARPDPPPETQARSADRTGPSRPDLSATVGVSDAGRVTPSSAGSDDHTQHIPDDTQHVPDHAQHTPEQRQHPPVDTAEHGHDPSTDSLRNTPAEWDERYSAADRIWSGEPNGALVAEVAGMEPGRVLDVGSGEGADAVWLAGRGWQVTGLEPSGVALGRAAVHAREAGVPVSWVHAGLGEGAFPDGPFDLVSAQYPALLHTPDHVAERALLDAVTPGGVLLVVHHAHFVADPDRSHGFDPADYVGPADIAALLDDDWQVEVDEERPRHVSSGAGAGHSQDVVLRARRLR